MRGILSLAPFKGKASPAATMEDHGFRIYEERDAVREALL